MDSDSVLGVIVWAAIVAGYGWQTWRLARAGRAPLSEKPERTTLSAIAEHGGHVPADAAAMIVVRRLQLRHMRAALGNTRRDASTRLGVRR